MSLYPGNRKITSAAESAVDGDPFTFALTDDGVGSSWNIEFFEERSISCFELVVSAGAFYLLSTKGTVFIMIIRHMWPFRIWFFKMRNLGYLIVFFIPGSYDVNVKSRDQVDQNCTEFELDPNFGLYHNISKCCNKEMKGTEFTITRRDKGPLRLYEVQFEGKYLSQGMINWKWYYMLPRYQVKL